MQKDPWKRAKAKIIPMTTDDCCGRPRSAGALSSSSSCCCCSCCHLALISIIFFYHFIPCISFFFLILNVSSLCVCSCEYELLWFTAQHHCKGTLSVTIHILPSYKNQVFVYHCYIVKLLNSLNIVYFLSAYLFFYISSVSSNENDNLLYSSLVKLSNFHVHLSYCF